jgi:hypothetical protein
MKGAHAWAGSPASVCVSATGMQHKGCNATVSATLLVEVDASTYYAEAAPSGNATAVWPMWCLVETETFTPHVGLAVAAQGNWATSCKLHGIKGLRAGQKSQRLMTPLKTLAPPALAHAYTSVLGTGVAYPFHADPTCRLCHFMQALRLGFVELTQLHKDQPHKPQSYLPRPLPTRTPLSA